MQHEREWFTPGEAVQFLNDKFKLERPIDTVRLSRLRRLGRISGEKLGGEKGRFTMFSRQELEKTTLEDIQDKRKTSV